MSSFEYKYKAELVRVVDGDTVVLNVDLGFEIFFKMYVRLAEIDTPEIYGVKKESEEYKKGQEAKKFVEEWFANNSNQCLIKSDKDDTGKYGRYLVHIFPPASGFDALSLNTTLVQDGNAVWID